MPDWGGSGYALFDARIRDRHSDVVVFTPASQLDRDGLRDAVKDYFDRRAPPDRVFLLGSSVVQGGLEDAAREGWIPDALEGVTGEFDGSKVVPLAFNQRGEIIDLLDRARDDLQQQGTVERMMRSGLWEIFDRNGGLHEVGPNYHFANPSGVHTSAFIRTGDVLRHSAEIGFIAMRLLQWWPERDPRQIYVDTASIVSVAYAVVELRQAFDDRVVAPAIDSFGGYAGLPSFQPRPGAWCLISASISGRLEDRIRASSDLAGIATLFYGGPRLSTDRRIVCDLVRREPSSFGIDEIVARKEGECDRCEAGQDVVQFSGDQFLPASPLVVPVLVRLSDAPDWLSRLVEALVGRSSARCHHLTRTGARRDIHLHLDRDGALADGAPLRTSFERQLNAALPAAITTVIHTDDEPSRALAARVEERYRELTGSEHPPKILSTLEAVAQGDPVAGSEGTVAAVTAVTASGRELLRISQILRRGAGGIVYLVALSRLYDATERTRIENNLTQADWRGRFRVVNGECSYLPRRESPWNRELRLFTGLRGEWDEGSAEAEAIAARIAQLEATELTDTLFLPRVMDGRLDLNGPGRLTVGDGFVFWAKQVREAEYSRHSQADVYLTISAVLHAMRSRQDGRPPLIQRGHNRTVLDPANFSRFTDGAIQAALLRATETHELQYDSRDDLSGQMFDIIQGMLDDVEAEASAALPEFLLALASRHLQLGARFRRALADRLEREQDLPPLLQPLRARVRKLAE